MIFLDTDVDYSKKINDDINDEEKQDMSAEEKMKLIARATLDRRLNTRDLKLYNYVMSFEYLSYTQEEISEMLDISRSNINKSLEKLASFNYIEKVQLKKGTKKMSYKLKGLSSAGIINPSPCEVIRVLNVSNVSDTECKFIYCPPDEFKELEKTIKEYKNNIDTIEKYYDSKEECHKKDLAFELVEKFDPNRKSKYGAIFTLKELIEEYEERISDTVEMRRKLNQFSQKLASKTNILSKDAVTRVLEDADAKFILFIDKNIDECLINFQERYLEDYVKFASRFSGLAENEDFFKLYYEDKKLEVKFTEFMRIIGHNHREVPIKRENAIDFITTAIQTFEKETDNMNLTDGAAALVQEISNLLEAVASDAVFNCREVALLLFVLDKRYCLKKNIGLSFDSFVEMYNPDLKDKFIGYFKSKNKKKTKTNTVLAPTGIEL